MATEKPRITITLDPDTYSVIKGMADVSGKPMSRIISGLLDDVSEPLSRTLSVMRAAAAAPEKLRSDIVKNYTEAGEIIETAYKDFRSEEQQILDLAEAKTPPSCNTGVTTTPPYSKTPKVRALRGK